MKKQGFLNIYDDQIDLGYNGYGNEEDGSEDEAVVCVRWDSINRYLSDNYYEKLMFEVLTEMAKMQDLGYDVQIFDNRNIEG